MTQPPPPVSASPADTRRALVDAAARAWTAQLVDLSGRNRLLYYRDQKVGTLDLAAAAPGPLEALVTGTKTRLSALFPDPVALADAARRCRTIRGKARENLEERGIDTLYIARSEATWTPAPGSAAVPAAPILLCRLELAPRGSAEEDFELHLAGDPELNPTLLFALETEFGVRVDPQALEAAAVPPDGEEIDAGLLAAGLAVAAAAVPGFGVRPRTVVGNFSYTKLPMVTDLLVHADALAAHDLVAAIAGDAAAQRAVRDRQGPVDPATLDAVPPASEFLVLDADASQQAVIEAVIRGSDSVVQGPPGTGKSQTISNLIASAAAQGLRVLFVAEKRAAIDAVIGRLDRTGLSDLVLDLHGGVSSRRRLAENLAAALGAARATPEPESGVIEEYLLARRTVLSSHARAVNERREPWGISLYAAQARSVAARRLGLDVRLSPTAVDGIPADRLAALKEALRAYLALGAVEIGDGSHPWATATTMDAATVEPLSDATTDLARDELPRLRRAVVEVAAEAGLPAPSTAGAGYEQALILDERARLASSIRDEAFDHASRLSPLLEPARRGWFSRVMAQLTSGAYRAALAEARALLVETGLSPDPGDVAARLAAAASLAARWSAVAGAAEVTARPPVLARAPELRATWDGVTSRMAVIGAVLPLPAAGATSLEALEAWARALDADLGTLRKLPELRGHLAAMTAAGLGELAAAVTARRLGVDDAVAALDGAWASAIVERVLARDGAVGGVDAERLDQESSSYGLLDRNHVSINAARVKRAWAERAVAARDAYPEQDLLVSTQAKRKIGHLPVRDLFAGAPDVLTAVKPCWAMSPLLVSQILPADRPYFDLVIFDEASQILPADAIPSILRGRRAVVAGDDLQLPPTIFFASQTALDLEAEEGAAALEGVGEVLATGFASILDIADPLIGSRPLRWHYRSRDERLIAFSNLLIYRPKHRELTTFPAVTDDACIRHVRVAANAGRANGESSAEEVDAVVRLILEHAQGRPEESLGVIAMGLKHAERIAEALRLARAGRPDLDDAFAEGGREPLFVKNLERVQGDERDAIILTIGYGRTSGGRLVQNFGPVNQQGGERRLNVAITRARRRLALVSSFGSEDVDPARSSSEGVRLLRSYLRYAESGGSDLGDVVASRPELNGFERDVLAALGDLGIAAVPQLGTSGYYLDYALQHPSKPGRFVLAVECDGTSYHSAPNTRERDRLRQQQLEAIGWRFHRIWSTDWYRTRDREVARLKAAYDEAVTIVDAAAAAAERAAFEAQVTADVVAARAAALAAGGASEAGAADAPGAADPPGAVPLPPAPPAPSLPPAPPGTPAPSIPPGPVQRSPGPSIGLAPATRGPRPLVFNYGSIAGMPPSQVDAVVAWIESDGLLRTSDEVVDEAMRELGFARRGTRIVAAIEASVVRTRARR